MLEIHRRSAESNISFILGTISTWQKCLEILESGDIWDDFVGPNRYLLILFDFASFKSSPRSAVVNTRRLPTRETVSLDRISRIMARFAGRGLDKFWFGFFVVSDRRSPRNSCFSADISSSLDAHCMYKLKDYRQYQYQLTHPSPSRSSSTSNPCIHLRYSQRPRFRALWNGILPGPVIPFSLELRVMIRLGAGYAVLCGWKGDSNYPSSSLGRGVSGRVSQQCVSQLCFV